MRINKIVIEGEAGEVEVRRTETGALVTANDVEIEVERNGLPSERQSVAYNAAKVIYGTDRRDRANATNSMIVDVLAEIERVAGCRTTLHAPAARPALRIPTLSRRTHMAAKTKTTTLTTITKKAARSAKPAPAAKAPKAAKRAAPNAEAQAAIAPATMTMETTKATKAKREAKQRPPKKASGLDLAAHVLAEAGEPLDAKTIAERVIAAGWTTSGATPHATLYAAIGREIATKSKDARFTKTGRGLFTTSANGKGA